MSQQSFLARWLHLLTSNGAERVNIPPQFSYPHRMPFNLPTGEQVVEPPAEN